MKYKNVFGNTAALPVHGHIGHSRVGNYDYDRAQWFLCERMVSENTLYERTNEVVHVFLPDSQELCH